MAQPGNILTCVPIDVIIDNAPTQVFLMVNIPTEMVGLPGNAILYFLEPESLYAYFLLTPELTIIRNLSLNPPIMVNGQPVLYCALLEHGDIIGVPGYTVEYLFDP